MFEIDSRDLGKNQVDLSSIQEWAGEVTNSFMNAGTDPNHTIKKIAQAEELTPHQVELVATESNKMIHTAKYASVENKYHAAGFPLADAQAIIRELQLDEGETKVAVDLPEPQVDRGPDVYEMFGIEPEKLDKTASVRHQVKTASDHVKLLLQKLDDKILVLEHQKTASERAFIKEARQYLLEQPDSSARVKAIGTLYHFAKCAGLEKTAKNALSKLVYASQKEGKLEPSHAKPTLNYFMSKEADQKVPEELISGYLQAKVVNGNHPLYITLKTIGDREAELLRYCDQRAEVQDKARILSQKVRAL